MKKQEEKEIKDLFHALKFGFMCKGVEKLLKRLSGSTIRQAQLMFDGQVKAEIVVNLEKGEEVNNFIKVINDHDKRLKDEVVEEIEKRKKEIIHIAYDKYLDIFKTTKDRKELVELQRSFFEDKLFADNLFDEFTEIINKHKNNE